MKFKCPVLATLFLLANYSLVFSQTQPPPKPIRSLRNGDVLRMHKAGMKPGEIIGKIVTSQCNFDTFPPVLRELKMKGLPDTVIMAMVMVPYGPPASARETIPAPPPPPQTAKVQIPAGTRVEVENISAVSSAHVSEGSRINLRVSRRVFVNGLLVIERGALARARVVKIKKARAWGRGGALDWSLEDVVAVDGTVVPIRLFNHVKGNNRSAAVVTAAIVTGAVVFPYSPPVGLIWGLKKGDEAILDESRKLTAVVGTNTQVEGEIPEKQRVILHPVEKLKAGPGTPGLRPMSRSFKPRSIRRINRKRPSHHGTSRNSNRGAHLYPHSSVFRILRGWLTS